MASTIEIFFCYAREDEELRKGLEKQLRALRRQGIIDVWHDREISAGTEWESEIDKHLNSAQIILLLVSPDFMDSEYCYGKEMMRAMERHERGEARVIPVILRPVYWEGAPFGKLQALPTDARAITSRYWHNLDEAYFNVAEGILKAVNELLKDQLLFAGSAHYKAQQFEEALTIYERIIRLDPKGIDAHKGKGDTLYRLSRYKEALASYEQAIILNPRNAILYNRKGKILEQVQQYQEALAAYEQAIRLNPNTARTYYNRGNVFNHLRYYKEALEDYEKAIKVNSRVSLYHNAKGNTLYELNCYEEALAAFEQAIQLDPNNTQYQNNRKVVFKLLHNQYRTEYLRVGFETHPGIHLSNEDSLFALKGIIEGTDNSQPRAIGLFIVSDGGITRLGSIGYLASRKTLDGEIASSLAVQTMIDYILPRVFRDGQIREKEDVEILIDGVRQANQAVHQRNREKRSDMGSTITATLIIGATAYVANVGHSRTYLYRRAEGLKKITTDHSVVASLVEAGIIKPGDIYTHPKRNQIYRSLGEKPLIDIDWFKVELQDNDRLLLCTKGLWTVIRDPDIEEIMSANVTNPANIAKELIEATLANSGKENMSAIVIYITKVTDFTDSYGIKLIAKPDKVTLPDLPTV